MLLQLKPARPSPPPISGKFCGTISLPLKSLPLKRLPLGHLYPLPQLKQPPEKQTQRKRLLNGHRSAFPPYWVKI
jgi:hypothetical protein